MQRLPRPRIALIAAAAAALLLAPALAWAAGGLPKPKHALVVPFKAMGAVRLGSSKAAALKAWGPANQCAVGTGGRTTCVWLSPLSTDYPEQGGILELSHGKVCGMEIRAGTNVRTGHLTITRLRKWKTAKGVGLGSRLKAAKQVLGGRLVVQRHHVTTVFGEGTTPASRALVEEITIFRAGCTVT